MTIGIALAGWALVSIPFGLLLARACKNMSRNYPVCREQIDRRPS